MVFIASLLTAGEVIAAQGETIRVSVDSAGVQGNGSSYYLSISSDGRYVAFQSFASNLVPNDTNGAADIFVHDRQTGQTTRVSMNSAGVQGNDNSYNLSISSDGRYVAFESYASNLVPNDTNYAHDIFVHDRQTGQTTRVSVDSAGVQGNESSYDPSISSDGRYVAFASYASNLVPNDTNGWDDVFVHDRQTGQSTRVSVDSAGVQGNGYSSYPSISSDGRYVAFWSNASNLVPNDTNAVADVFVHDRHTGQTTRVSVNSAGVQGNSGSSRPSISSDGRYVAFESYASNLVPNDTNDAYDIFVHDRQIGQSTRVSVNSAGVQGNGHSYSPSISSDGRYVAFESGASNLVPNDTNHITDVFVHDRQTGQSTRVSVDSEGVQGNNESRSPSISSDGRYVAFPSFASNLVSNDTNYAWDIFVHDYLDPIEPVPDIKANGSDGPIIVSPTEPVSITVGLYPGSQTGQRADWWIGAFTLFGRNYWLNPSLQWVPCRRPISVGQYPLFKLPETKLLDTPLPVGIYIFFFVLDPPDGKFGVTLYDYVIVISQPEIAPMDTLPDFRALFQEKIEELRRESQESREP